MCLYMQLDDGVGAMNPLDLLAKSCQRISPSSVRPLRTNTSTSQYTTTSIRTSSTTDTVNEQHRHATEQRDTATQRHTGIRLHTLLVHIDIHVGIMCFMTDHGILGV